MPLSDLRYLQIGYWDFSGKPHVGELIVNATAVEAMRSAFAKLFAEHFPLRSMRLVDDYKSSDFASIEADNTSAFNCRLRTGSKTEYSQHSYGLAIDVDPLENPYVDTDGTTAHQKSRPYLDRTNVRPGMAVAGGALVEAFRAVGWIWGGTWDPPPVDLQHFSPSGR